MFLSATKQPLQQLLYLEDQSDFFDPIDVENDFFFQTESAAEISFNYISFVHQANPVCKHLDSLGAIYLGGYPLALYNTLLDPSLPFSEQLVNSYKDIDVMGKNSEHTKVLAASLDVVFDVTKTYESKKAITKWVMIENREHIFQFVTFWHDNPCLAMSHFDFDNCKVAYYPDKGFLIHNQAQSAIQNNELTLSSDWEEFEPDEKIRILSIIRANKYCDRWNWKLDPLSFERLVACSKLCSEEFLNEPILSLDSGNCVLPPESNSLPELDENDQNVIKFNSITLEIEKLFDRHRPQPQCYSI